jgi:hypothetical protein
MSRFYSSLLLFEAMDGLDDAFIQEGMLPDTAVMTPIRGGKTRRKGSKPLLRFMNSGWAVAMLCAVVSLSVLVAVVRLGLKDPAGNLDPPGENLPNDGFTGETLPSETDELPTLPEESNRVPAGTASVDEAGLRYVSNGDGTCICMGFVSDEGQTVIHIPDYSPHGDVVISIYGYAFRDRIGLTEVTLPAGLRSYDRNTFPMEADIYHLCGNILYLGSDDNPYLVAVSTADNRPGATSLHHHTRLLADRALTYDSGSYFAMKWADQIPAYTDSEVFSLPSSLAYVGAYALLDVGRDITYGGYLVGWDALTARPHAGLSRTPDGTPVTVHCLDGTILTEVSEPLDARLDSTAYVEDGILFGGYYTYYRGINESYYDWVKDPEAYTSIPEQFVTDGAVFGIESRVLTADELDSVRFALTGTADASLSAFAETYNQDPAALYKGKSVVMVFLSENSLCRHTVTEVAVSEGKIHVILTRLGEGGTDAEGERFLLIPVRDPEGELAGAEVSFTVRDE